MADTLGHIHCACIVQYSSDTGLTSETAAYTPAGGLSTAAVADPAAITADPPMSGRLALGGLRCNGSIRTPIYQRHFYRTRGAMDGMLLSVSSLSDFIRKTISLKPI